MIALGLALATREAPAQNVGRWELGLFGGGTFGTRLFLDPTNEIRVGNSTSYGGRLSYSFDRARGLEATYSHTTGHLRAKNVVTGEPIFPNQARLDIDTYELDGLYTFGHGNAKGTFSLGAGAMTFHSSALPSENGTAVTANVALGGKVFLSRRLSLRADARYRWRLRKQETSEVSCGDDGCMGVTTNLYSSAEVTGGISFRFGGERDHPLEPTTPQEKPVIPATSAATKGTTTRFFTALGELALVEAVPWAFDRYVAHEDFSYISLHTVNENLRTGFTYDRDDFRTNQALHPYHGGLFFNTARSNGYGYWESGAFSLAGSFIWECCMENTAPSINDLVNTTLGGMALGEITHREAVMLRDNTARGFTRFLRELGGAILDPVGAVNRLTHGDMTWNSPNPDERFPSAFTSLADVGYRHVGASAEEGQETLSLATTYGDPFAGEIRTPFQYFAVESDLNSKGDIISRVEGRGILRGWELTDPTSSARQIVGFFQEYEYFANRAQVFGAQSFSFTLLSRYTLGNAFTVTTDIGLMGMPLAGIQTIGAVSEPAGQTRTYDYGPGGGARGGVRIDVKNGPSAAATYGVLWSTTADGVSDSSNLQFFRALGRIPLFWKLGIGGGYSWYSRKTSYPTFFEERQTQNEWRAFLTIRLSATKS